MNSSGLSEIQTSRNSAKPSAPTLVRGLTLLDSVLLLVGGIVGSSIFLTAKDIAGVLPSPALFLLVWVFGGLISLFACFAFAEMAAMFPDSGGQYVYMREAYGDFVGFLYGWMIFAVSNGGSIAALAVASSEYSGAVIPAISSQHIVLSIAGFSINRAQLVAVAMIAFMTWMNVVGLRRGAVLQNLATWAKFGAMAVFVILGIAIGKGSWSHFSSGSAAGNIGVMGGLTPLQLVPAFGVALIAVFWAYDGWVYITWVAGEVKLPQKTIPRSLMLGIATVAVLYLSMNLMYVYAMPFSQIKDYSTIAHASASRLFSPGAAVWLSVAIAVSCFGAAASCTLSGGRVYYAMARDGVFFQSMAKVHPRWRTPAVSLIWQGVWSSALALSGRYDQLYTYVMFMMVLSYVAAVVALFIFRWKRPDAPRPYRCTGYPWLPAIYVAVAGAWALNTIYERPKESLAGILIVLIGVPGYLYWHRQSKKLAAG